MTVLAGGARCNSGSSVDTWLHFPAGPPVLGAPLKAPGIRSVRKELQFSVQKESYQEND